MVQETAVRHASTTSARVAAIPQALSIYVNQLVYDLKRRGEDVTVLSLGEAYFDVPLFGFEALDPATRDHYTDSRGIPELRERVAAFYRRAYGAPVDPARGLLVTAGSKIAIAIAMLAVLDPGDELVLHEPAWLSYPEQARICGASTRFIPHDVTLEQVPNWFGPRTRLFVLNNPNNPAGRVYTRNELSELYRACRDRGVWLLTDEAYSDFVAYGGFTSLAEIAPDGDGAIVVNSLSKNLGISGWRIGYLISSAPFVDAALALNQHLVTCAPSILQHYLARYFDQLVAVTLPQARAVAEKRGRVAGVLDRLGLRAMNGSSTFYFFIDIGNYPGTSFDLTVSMLLDRGVAVVPGSAYGASTERFVRISVGTESEARIEAALTALHDELQAPSYRPEGTDDRLRAAGLCSFSSAAGAL